MKKGADDLPNSQTCCCSQIAGQAPRRAEEHADEADAEWIAGSIHTPVGSVPKVSTKLLRKDRTTAWKARWGIGRMRHRVKPQLYAVGNPTDQSPVFVSANYKISFDRLRSALAGIDGWILALDTKGINVWCAAGKGTFGTDELVRQIGETHLDKVVAHKRLIVPQLGASGVAAHVVKERSGFKVRYGPVRAADIPAFLAADMKATPEMRRVEFPLADRMAVVPVELVHAAKWVVVVMLALLLLGGLGTDGYSLARAASAGLASAGLFLLAFLAGTILAPALLPWLPGRALSLKGVWVGVAMLATVAVCAHLLGIAPENWIIVAAWCVLIPVTTSFAAMAFTGSTTYTSLSGVRREMRVAVPIQAVATVFGVVALLTGRFVGG